MGITAKRLVATLRSKYNPIQRVMLNIVGMRPIELSHATKMRSKF